MNVSAKEKLFLDLLSQFICITAHIHMSSREKTAKRTLGQKCLGECRQFFQGRGMLIDLGKRVRDVFYVNNSWDEVYSPKAVVAEIMDSQSLYFLALEVGLLTNELHSTLSPFSPTVTGVESSYLIKLLLKWVKSVKFSWALACTFSSTVTIVDDINHRKEWDCLSCA